MKKYTQHQFLTLLFLAASLTTFAQVGVGTTTPEGALDVTSTISGLVLPRVANTGAVTNPQGGAVVNGTMVYDLSANCVKVYQNGVWSDCIVGNNAAPVASSVTISGTLEVGKILTGVYSYSDAEGDTEGTSLFRWFRADDAVGTNGGIIGTAKSYTLQSADATKYISFRVTPVASTGTLTGVAVTTSYQGPVGEGTDVTGAGGAIWMDRNLGATRVATSSTDEASYGDLYQWGRGADGHESRTSGTTSIKPTTDTPGHGNFILGVCCIDYDWRSTQNDNLWQGVSGINNPCPSGYRLPTETELNTERLAWSSNNSAGAFASPLKLPAAGARNYDGSLINRGVTGSYWSSTVASGGRVRVLGTGPVASDIFSYGRGVANSVRCIKN